MSYRLNLNISPRKVSRGGIDLFFNWENRPDGGTEPAYIFVKSTNHRGPQYRIPLSFMHNVVESSGFPLIKISVEGIRAARCIGFSEFDKSAAKTIADMILDYTEDLKNMPGEPPTAYQAEVAAAAQKAELSILMDGQTVFETEVAA